MVWFYSENTARFCKTFIESMSDMIKASKASKGGETKFWTTSACDENVY